MLSTRFGSAAKVVLVGEGGVEEDDEDDEDEEEDEVDDADEDDEVDVITFGCNVDAGAVDDVC